ncbi:hypothetical protein SK128_009234 [Halocaridina rubra]|uniref:Galactosylgalactosylxylosylprotein 3-beta-glucuronosyltransferase n=1 Tax=Halocaridina rubra TaxID=373956 RepID=A0AAN8XHV9_HALRR
MAGYAFSVEHLLTKTKARYSDSSNFLDDVVRIDGGNTLNCGDIEQEAIIPSASMPYTAGYEEDGFLRSLQIQPEDYEFLADGCTKIYVWHTQTKKNNPSDKKILGKQYDGTNLRILQKVMTLQA